MKKEKMTLYQISVEPCEEGGFFASCPLLQGCHAEGGTFGEAIDNLESVIEAHLEVRQKAGEVIPMIETDSYQNMNFQIPIPMLA